MSPKPLHAVVYWTQEQKAGIEPLNNIPEHGRFEGSVGTVMFSGDKRWYPAKVIMISDDMDALSAKEEEIALSILEQKKQQDKPVSRLRNKKTNRIVVGIASEQQVASALGTKPPVPKHLTAEHTATQQAKKDARVHSRSGQDQLDGQVLNKVKVNLIDSFNKSGEKEGLFDGDLDQIVVDHDSDKAEDISDSNTSDHEMAKENENVSGPIRKSKWCDCTPCTILAKYDSPTYLGLLKDLIKLLEERDEESSKQKFLKLKDIPDGVRQVELTIGTGVHISRSVKDQIKVDFSNKASALIRETLFALYGKEPFQTLNITARGNKYGTYGIEENVLTALTAFINRHLEKKMKLRDIVATINKRTTEWRTKCKTPSPKANSKNKKNSKNLKVVSTSPFKVRPLTVTSPSKDTKGKPASSPRRFSPSPKKGSPLKLVSPANSHGPPHYPTFDQSSSAFTAPQPSSSGYQDQYNNYWSNYNSHEYPSWQSGWSGQHGQNQPPYSNHSLTSL